VTRVIVAISTAAISSMAWIAYAYKYRAVAVSLFLIVLMLSVLSFIAQSKKGGGAK
jgi:hypothetical protein